LTHIGCKYTMPTKKKTSQKKVNRKKVKLVSKEDDMELYEDNIDEDAEFDVDDVDDVNDDEFFDENNFKDFNTNIKFHVFDPDKYKNEIHKEIIIVPSMYRKTSEVITKFEFTDVTSNRAKQIENGSKIFVDIGDVDDPIIMAEMEIKMKQCPLAIRRLISNNIAEVWDVNEMIIPYVK
jgi:DNA-directed RNA polymerase subunit K/omega